MDPRPCTVTDDAGTWPGWVLAWRNTATGWRGLVRYLAPHESGHELQRERWMPEASLEGESSNDDCVSLGMV